MLAYPSLCRKAVQALGTLDLGSGGAFLSVDTSIQVVDGDGTPSATYAWVHAYRDEPVFVAGLWEATKQLLPQHGGVSWALGAQGGV